jgi:hypothetical protein
MSGKDIFAVSGRTITMPSEEREQRIRELAQALWEQEGRPEGQAERHWQMAEKAAGTGPIVNATLKSRPWEATASR